MILDYAPIIFLAIFLPLFILGMIGQAKKQNSLVPQIQSNSRFCNYHFDDIVEYCLGQKNFTYKLISDGICSFKNKHEQCKISAKYQVI